jgi:hypothetical protein
MPVRVALILLTALALFHGIVQRSSWVSGWMPPAVAVGVVLLYRMPRFTITVSFGLAPAIAFAGYRALTLVSDTEKYSLLTRMEAWRVLSSVVSESPLVGLGPANYYHYTELFPILGWYVKFSSHNNYIDLIAQIGLVGFAAFLWLAFEILRLNWSLRRLTGAQNFTSAYIIGALGGVIATLVSGMLGDWIIPFVYNTGLPAFRSSLLFWVFAGGLLALRRMSYRQQPVPSVAGKIGDAGSVVNPAPRGVIV